MKIKRSLIAGVSLFLAPISLIHAAEKGTYLGGQIGYAYSHQGEFIANQLNKQINQLFPGASLNSFFKKDDVGPMGSLFLGYQLNDYIALEVGYLYFGAVNIDLDAHADIEVLKRLGIDIPIDISSNVNVNTSVFDLLAKGMFPITKQFSLYAKLGAAYLRSQGKAWLVLKTDVGQIHFKTNPRANILYPMFGVGMNYDMTDHVSADLAWMRIQQTDPFPFPSIDYVAAGLIYHF